MSRLPQTFLLFLCLGLNSIQASESRFAIVLIDSETERQYGEFPIDRRLIARGIDRLAEMKAKGLVLKFFYDLPKEVEGDAALAKAMGRLPTLLQARIDDSEPHSNLLPERFFFNVARSDQVHSVSGQSGWIPMPIFSDKARDVGFVDISALGQTDIVEIYQGKIVRSLALCCLELALDSKATITPGKSLTLGGKFLPLDSQNRVPIQFPATNRLDYLKFHDLLAGKIDPHQIKGKVVILGYDGDKIPKLESPLGPIGAHRYFIYSLKDLEERIEQGNVGVDGR